MRNGAIEAVPPRRHDARRRARSFEGPIFRHRVRTHSRRLGTGQVYRLLFERGGIWFGYGCGLLRPSITHTALFCLAGRAVHQQFSDRPASRDPLAREAEVCEHPNRWLPYDDLSLRMHQAAAAAPARQSARRHSLGRGGPIGSRGRSSTLGSPPRRCRRGTSIRCRTRVSVCCSRAGDGGRSPPGESRAVHLWNTWSSARERTEGPALSTGLALRAAVGPLRRGLTDSVIIRHFRAAEEVAISGSEGIILAGGSVPGFIR